MRFSVRVTAALALFAGVLVVGTACRIAPSALDHATGSVEARDTGWVRVYTDPAFTVAMDTSRVERIASDAFLVWFETRWAHPHQTQAPSPFNRETIRTILRCEPVAYKTVHVSVSLDAGPVVAEQGGNIADAERQNWKVPATGSADEHSFVAACAALSPADDRPPPPSARYESEKIG